MIYKLAWLTFRVFRVQMRFISRSLYFFFISFFLQKTMRQPRAYSVALSTVFSLSRSRVICSALAVGGLGFPWPASRCWNPHLAPLLRHAKQTIGRWMPTIPPNSETSSFTCSTTLHLRNWPASSFCEAESRSTLWSTEANTDRLKLWRAW